MNRLKDKGRQFFQTAYLLILSVLLLGGMACSGSNKKENKTDSQSTVQTSKLKKEIVMPTIPALITHPEDRLKYLANHYWDNFDFNDTTYIHLPEVTDQAFANYLDLLGRMESKDYSLALQKMLSTCEKVDKSGKVYSYFLSLMGSYLYDPNSPMRNEELYYPVVNYIVTDSVSNQVVKDKARYTIELINMNRVGTKATNFSFTTTTGKIQNLNLYKGKNVLIYFYNPDCNMCKQVAADLKTSDVVNRLLDSKKLVILGVYLDEDLKSWKEHLPELPTSKWVVGYDKDQKIKMNHLYDIKAIPSLYLLNQDLTVALKDSDFATVEYVLSQLH